MFNLKINSEFFLEGIESHHNDTFNMFESQSKDFSGMFG